MKRTNILVAHRFVMEYPQKGEYYVFPMAVRSSYHQVWSLIFLVFGVVLFFAQTGGAQAVTIFSGSPPDADTSVTATDTFILDSDNSGTDISIQFGATLNETLKWNDAQNYFEFSDALVVGGNLNVNGTVLRIDFDNAGAGVDVDIVAEQGSDLDGTLRYSGANNRWEISNNGGAFLAIATGTGGADDFEGVYANDTDDTLTTSNGSVTFATGTGDFIIDSNDWNVTAAGALDAAAITSTGTFTLNGAGVIGDGADDIAINSNDWDISSAGVGSGFTGFTSAGAISLGDNSGTVVFDGTNFDVTSAGAVTLTGHMTLSGDASEGLSGGGLVDCDASTGRLQWDATTNKFSCLTYLGPDTATFSDTTPGTMADNNTTELFNDTTRPNITTDSTSATVLISLVITDAAAAGADDEFDAIRIIRETDGTNPSCAADPQVGAILQGGFVTATTHPWGIQATVLDSPGFAGNIRYTVCTSAQSIGTVDNVPDRIDVTLVELGN